MEETATQMCVDMSRKKIDPDSIHESNSSETELLSEFLWNSYFLEISKIITLIAIDWILKFQFWELLTNLLFLE